MGGYKKRIAAGWDRAAIIAALREHAECSGSVPTYAAWRATQIDPSPDYIAKEFGSWLAAITAAGLSPYRSISSRRPFDRDGVVAALRVMAERLGRTPTSKDWRAARARPCCDTIRKEFGGWDHAVEAAGMVPARQPRKERRNFGRNRQIVTAGVKDVTGVFVVNR